MISIHKLNCYDTHISHKLANMNKNPKNITSFKIAQTQREGNDYSMGTDRQSDR